MERRFTTIEPPPEAAPELAAAPTVEEGLAATAPQPRAEGGEGFAGREGLAEEPLQLQVEGTQRLGGEEYATEEGQIGQGGQPEYIRVPPRQDVPTDTGEARTVSGEQAGDSGGAGAAAAEPVKFVCCCANSRWTGVYRLYHAVVHRAEEAGLNPFNDYEKGSARR